MVDDGWLDRLSIREAIENWVLWRDAGEWDRLAGLWADDAVMITTWSQSSASEFIARSRRAWDAGLKVLHVLGGASVEIRGDRAVAQTKMEIIQRAPVDGVLVDVHCLGRFFDLFERREGRWLIALRQPVYEMDRMTPVDPTAKLELDPQLLMAFPEGYRHLAYLQTKAGFNVTTSAPGTRGPGMEALLGMASAWLRGDDLDRSLLIGA